MCGPIKTGVEGSTILFGLHQLTVCSKNYTILLEICLDQHNCCKL
jgi:hypothetical protein